MKAEYIVASQNLAVIHAASTDKGRQNLNCI